MSSVLKNIFTIAMLLAIAGAGYYFFVLQSGSELSVSRTNEGELLTNEFIKRLNELQQIDLTGEIFSNPKFLSLVDFSTVPEPVTTGRDNPFTF